VDIPPKSSKSKSKKFLAIGTNAGSGGGNRRSREESRDVGGIVVFESMGFSTTEAQLDVCVFITHVCFVCVSLEPEETIYNVDGTDTGKEGMEA
jgi:hypothetical protein